MATSRDLERAQLAGTREAPLSIRLLGGFGIRTPTGAAVRLPGQRSRTLVAYLLLHREVPSDRRRLAFLLWPDSTERQALTNLRQLIHDVRASLPEPDRFLEAGRQLVRWRIDAPCSLDVYDLETALALAARVDDGTTPPIGALERAVALYRGDLLPECYDEWIEEPRQRLRNVLVDALRRLVSLLEHRRDYRAALPHLERLVGMDPLDEASTLALMRLHAADGERARALEAFRRFEALLHEELGLAPGAALRELCDRLRAMPDANAIPPVVAPSLPFVGRTTEWGALTEAWAGVQRGGPRGVLVSGVAGIGKTRLAEEFAQWVRRQGATVALSRCYGAAGRLPYGPIVDWLGEPSLASGVSALPEAWRSHVARILPDAAIPAGREARPARESRPAARRGLFDGLVRALVAAPPPLLLIVDDVQWVDRETLEWIGYLLNAGTAVPALVLATRRSGEAATVGGLDAALLELERDGRMREVTLTPLDMAATTILGTAAAGAALGPRAARALYRETEGHPLFIVESMRARAGGVRGGRARADGSSDDDDAPGRPRTGPSPAPTLPQRVLAVIRSRLGQLSPGARAAIGAASAIGREFGVDQLADAAGLSEHAAAAAVEELTARRLVDEQGDGAYNFAHDSIRQVAYAGLSAARRQVVHRRIARTQITQGAGPAAAASAIARHLEQGGFIEGAIPYYRMAAEHALDVYAGAEAVLHLDRAVALLARLPATQARRAQEIELRAALCVALVSVEMFSGARILDQYERVRALCDQAGLTPGPPVLRTLAIALVMKGEVAEAADIGRRLLSSVPPAGNPVLLVEARYVLGITAYWQGDFVGACRHLEAALDAYRPEHAREHIGAYGQDAGAVCGVRLAQALWALGRPDEARRALHDSLERAVALAHPHTLAYARQFGACVLVDLGDHDAARRQIEAAVEVAAANELSGWPIMNQVLDGYLTARAGEADRGITMMRRAAKAWTERGWTLAVPYHRALLAEVCLGVGRLRHAADAIEEGEVVARATGQRFWDAELLRLRAAVAVARGDPGATALRTLDAARRIATRQGALALEARVARSRARLAAARVAT